MQPGDRARDRRTRHTFWIDDRVIDEFGPVMGRFPFGAVALAVYAVLARTADREGDSWPSLRLLTKEAASSERTVQRAIRLLELLGLVEVASCYEAGSQRQTSNLYTLLTPPDPVPEVEPDPSKWPEPVRRTLLVRSSTDRREAVSAARLEQRGFAGVGPKWAGIVPVLEKATPRQADAPSPATPTPPRRQRDALPPVSTAPQEGNTREGNPGKDGAARSRKADLVFAITEIGLSNRQVWAAALAELARRGDVGAGELETWLRPARLVGREGGTLLVGAPNAVARDRIAGRMLPALREALGATIGVPLAVAVVVEE
jgi:hypothetical protein